ncbi:MAG: transketolase [Chloroflexota bacterium]
MTFLAAPPCSGVNHLEAIAREVRGTVVRMSHRAGAAHLGSALSCVDILVAAYWTALRLDPRALNAADRDRLILSKGHAASALYAVLSRWGVLAPDLLETYGQDGALLSEHPSPEIPGVEAATGSLGHGLSLGVGMALAGRIQHNNFRVFVVLSDGECNEGSVWEAAMMAAARRLDNVVAIVDYNKWQATDRSDEVLALSPLRDKWQSFGWTAHEVDGHDIGALSALLAAVPDGSGKPIAIVAHTTKGRGVSFMEDDNNWHYRIPTALEVDRAFGELGLV